MWSVENFKNVMVGLSPIIIAAVGWYYTQGITDREVAADYVDMAVDILNDKDLGAADGRDLRTWAVQVVNKYSAVKMDATVQEFVTERGFLEEIYTFICIDSDSQLEVDCPDGFDPFPDTDTSLTTP